MVKDAEPAEKQREAAFRTTFLLLVVGLVCSIVVLVAPRPVQPSQLPALRLPGQALSAQRSLDRQQAIRGEVLARDPDVAQLLKLYVQEGLAELEIQHDLAKLAEQRSALTSLSRRLFLRLGERDTRALISHTTDRALAGLFQAGVEARPRVRERREDNETRGLLGSFPSLLARHGYVDREGRLLAPMLSIRALYKERFNKICERPLERDLSPIELMAYEGWNALHAGRVPAERRAQAAQEFFRVGGKHGAEAAAIWLFQGGAHAEALRLLRSESERTGELRLRNMALYIATRE